MTIAPGSRQRGYEMNRPRRGGGEGVGVRPNHSKL
jgi:hypothetical protein